MDTTKVKPLGMYQTSENEFLLVYQWGACFVTKCMSPPPDSGQRLTDSWGNIKERAVFEMESSAHIFGL